MLSNSVQEARDEAASGPGSVEVLVVQRKVDRLTPVADVEAYVALSRIPESALVPGALTSLDDIRSGFVTTAELLPGEQLLADRFAAPQTAERLEVPEGLQEVTVAVPSARALGGSVVVGDRVGVLGSFTAQGDAPAVTDFVLHRALVTAVQYSSDDIAQVTDGTEGNDVPLAPQGTLLITFALSSQEANALVFTDQFGAISLTRQDETTETGDEQAITLESVFAGAS